MRPESRTDTKIISFRNIVSGCVWLFYEQSKPLLLWAPVFLSAGIGCYFSLLIEPPIWMAYLLGALVIAPFALAYIKRIGAAAGKSHGLQQVVLMAIGLFCLGMLSAQIRTLSVAAPVIDRVVETKSFRGVVEQKDITRRGFTRLTLRPLSIEGLSEQEMPTRVVLVSYKIAPAMIKTGQVITAKARLEPSYRPTHPGAYDPAHRDYFQQIGARGRLLGEVGISTPKTSGFKLYVEQVRQDISDHVLSQINIRAGPQLTWQMGPFATALLTGKRSLMDTELVGALRSSGLAHILAISGLHMVLLTGALFFITRLILSLYSRLALLRPIKKYAAVIALIGGAFYLLISGAPLSAQRAFIMVAIAFLAVIFDRRAISLHNLALAAMIILLLRPESLTSISFQMSFSSVAALVAFYEMYQRLPGPNLEKFGILRGPIIFLTSIFLTTLIASIATLPYVVHYFGALPTYGLLANMLVMPIFSIMTMPLALLVLFLTPLGLDGFAFELMGYSLKLISDVATYVSSLDGSLVIVPHISFMGLLCLVIAGLWLILWKKPVVWFFALPFCLAFIFILNDRKPDLLISERGKLFALKSRSGDLSLSDKGSSYVAKRWLQYYGDERRISQARLDNGISCDQAGCVGVLNNPRGQRHTISLIRDFAILEEECLKSDILIIAVPIRAAPHMCNRPKLIISRLDLWRHGSHALYLQENGEWRLKTAASAQGRRPWNREWVYQQKRN